jgi:hypothetical protein
VKAPAQVTGERHVEDEQLLGKWREDTGIRVVNYR